MSKKYIKSRWCYVFKKGDNYALFNSKSLEIFFVDKDIVDLLDFFDKPQSMDEVFLIYKNKTKEKSEDIKKVLETLKEKHFVVSESIDEAQIVKDFAKTEKIKKEKRLGKTVNLNAFRIVLTERCNLNCNYCFVKSKEIDSCQDITLETIKAGIDSLMKLNKNKIIEIQFFGGEPMLRFDLIKKTVEYTDRLIRQNKLTKVHYGVTTNAILITNDIAKYFKENKFLVSVSLDGWEELHNKDRIYVDGRGSYIDSVNGIKLLQEYKNDLGILVTPSKDNINKLAQACEYIIKELDCKFITINTPQPINGNWEVSGKQFSGELKKCFAIAKKNDAIINNFGTRVLYGLNDKRPLLYACSKFGENYTATLTPDGKISPCIVSWEHKDTLTNLKKFKYQANFIDWKLTDPYYFKKCLFCPAMNICGGPCPLEIYEMKRFNKKIDHERCNFFPDFLEWSIWYKG